MRIENTSASTKVRYITPTKTDIIKPVEPIPQFDSLAQDYFERMGAEEFISYLADLLHIDLHIKKPRKSKKDNEEAI